MRLPVLGSAGWQLPYGSARPNVLQLVPAHTADFGAPLAGQEQDREQSCKGARPAVQPLPDPGQLLRREDALARAGGGEGSYPNGWTNVEMILLKTPVEELGEIRESAVCGSRRAPRLNPMQQVDNIRYRDRADRAGLLVLGV